MSRESLIFPVLKSGLGLVMVVVASTLLLGACSGGGGGETAAVETTAAQAEPEVAEASTAQTGAGQELFQQTCAVCHGANAEGVQGLGKNLNANEFVQSKSDAELVAFLVEGREADHPDNTQGVAMPPKGGNPMLTEDDLQQIVTHLRSLQ
jgi:mono/diheme cytochrome c family protein